MYTRFVTPRRDYDSRCLEGIFHAVYRLRRSDAVRTHDREQLEQLVEWFKQHLPIPDCLLRPGAERAICWFQPDATEMLQSASQLQLVLQEYGVHVQRISTRHPGDALYQDRWQVVAAPWRGRRSPRF